MSASTESPFIENTGLCGDPFWDDFRVLYGNTSEPLLTECFQHTVLALVPCLFFWITVPAIAIQVRAASKSSPLPWTWLTHMKWLVHLILIGDKIFLLVVAFMQNAASTSSTPPPPIDIVYPAVQLATLGALLLVSLAARQRGVDSLGAIFLTYLLFALLGLPEFYIYLTIGFKPDLVVQVDFYRYLAYLVWYPVVVFQFFLHCFADPLTVFSKKHDDCPEERASFLNRQLFHWFSPIVSLGSKKPLEVSDLYRVRSDMTTDAVEKRWNAAWLPRYNAYLERKSAAMADARIKELMNESTPLTVNSPKARSYGATKGDDGGDSKSRLEAVKLPSIVACIASLFKWDFVGVTVIKLMSDVLQFANPLLLDQLIAFTESTSAPWWHGVVFAVALFLSTELRSLLLNNYFFVMQSVGVNVQTTLLNAVYKKSLRISTASKQSTGEIMNLMAIDVERFQNIIPQIQQYWSSPLQISLALFLLWRTVGFAALAGVLVIICLVPVNMFVSIKVKKWQHQQMRMKDERMAMTNEVLAGIRVVKLYAWEPPLEEAIEKLRARELQLIRRASLTRLIADVINVFSPFVVSLVSFAVFTLSSPTNILTPNVAFVSLTLFNQLRPPLMMIADLIGQTVQVMVSNRRIKEFLVSPEIDPTAVEKDPTIEGYDNATEVEDGYFSWTAKEDAILRELHLVVPRGSLYAVVGRVGSAKSSLLSAILGEMHHLRGYVGLRGHVAYVSQQPWIRNQSLRDNIIMDGQFDEQRYRTVIEACALIADLKQLPFGDLTEIGEKGVNLSGGQKMRVALARAIYQQCDVYFLDDPLAAVDAHVAHHIFSKVIGPGGLLDGKTRLLVTHGLSWLPLCEKIVVMQDGTITHCDKYETLVDNPDIANIIRDFTKEEDDDDEDGADDEEEGSVSDGGDAASSSKHEPAEGDGDNADDREDEEADDETAELAGPLRKAESRVSRRSTSSAVSRSSHARSRKKKSRTVSDLNEQEEEQLLLTGAGGSKKLKDKAPPESMKKESAQTGRVKSAVYLHYARSMGVFQYVIPFAVFLSISTASQLIRNLWLSDWSNDNVQGVNRTNGEQPLSLGVRLGVFAGLGVTDMLGLGGGLMALVLGGVAASKNMHRPLLHNLLRSPLVFFDLTPLGRILNRLGKDMEMVDLRLSSNFRFLAIAILNLVQTIIIVTYSTPFFIIFLIPMLVLYLLILRYFIHSSRQLQRLTSIARSPIYSLFGETLHGLSTIRAFNKVDNFTQQMRDLIDTFTRCRYLSLQANRWLAVRMEMLGNVTVLVAALLAVWYKITGVMTPGLIGLAISYSFNVTFMLNMFVRQISEVETNIVAVERVKEYCDTPTEKEWRGGEQLPLEWPQKGRIVFLDYSTRYRPDLEPVFHSIHLVIEAGQRVGVVGRTGAGKSTLALALFRIVEPTTGRITIDGIDITQIGLHSLRESITIIPQEPVLFSGTLRFNLDPFDRYSDAQLWQAVEDAGLRPFVSRLTAGLAHPIDEGGKNISVGERQLCCLARALLRKSRVLVLDEATAAVDTATDTQIQQTLRSQFTTSTVITIAHRLNTIMDYDRVLVLADGRVAEFDSPQNLLAYPNGLFQSMARAANIIP